MKIKSFFFLGVFLVFTLSQTSRAELPSNYESLSAIQKQGVLWDEIVKSRYADNDLPVFGPELLSLGKLFFSSFLTPTFTHTSDEMPIGRLKLIHTYGAVAQVEFKVNPESSKYSGLFKSGGIGLARLSLATQIGSYTPGMALKIFIDQKPSVNFQVMYSLDGQGFDRNFFAHEFSNVIEPPRSFALKLLAEAFSVAVNSLSSDPSKRPASAFQLPLLEAAEVSSDGTGVVRESVLDPLVIVFTPDAELKKFFSSDNSKDLRIQLGDISAHETVLYNISVKKSLNDPEESIGQLVLKSDFIASEYGDSKLFFQHQRQSSNRGN